MYHVSQFNVVCCASFGERLLRCWEVGYEFLYGAEIREPCSELGEVREQEIGFSLLDLTENMLIDHD